MAVEGMARCMKIVLAVFNVLVFIAGAIAIGLGVWSLVSDYGADEMEAITGNDLYLAGCIVIIVGGSIVAIISCIGCCGAIMENKVLLGIYFVIMLIFLIVFVVAAVLGFFFKDDLKEELEKEMKKTLTEKYGIDVDNNDDNRAVTDVWDKIQRELECCGVSGGLTGTESWFLWQSSSWFNAQQNPLARDYVPLSCCNTNFQNFNSAMCQAINTDTDKPIQISVAGISISNPALYEKGCVNAVEDKIMDHIIAVAVIAVVVLVIMLMCIIFSVYVCMHIRKNSMVV